MNTQLVSFSWKECAIAGEGVEEVFVIDEVIACRQPGGNPHFINVVCDPIRALRDGSSDGGQRAVVKKLPYCWVRLWQQHLFQRSTRVVAAKHFEILVDHLCVIVERKECTGDILDPHPKQNKQMSCSWLLKFVDAHGLIPRIVQRPKHLP